MLFNFFKIAIRNLIRNGFSALINILGLCIGLTFSLLILIWIINEKSYDTFHDGYENIHLLLNNNSSATGGIQTTPGVTPNVKQAMLNSIPEINAITQIYTSNRWPNDLCLKRNKDEGECLYRMGIYADSSFYEVFSFGILKGDPDYLKTTSIGLTESTAQELFGEEDPIGEKLYIDYFEVEVAAILPDVPENSSLQYKFIMSMDVVRRLRGITNDENWNNYRLDSYLKTVAPVNAEFLSEKLNDDKTILSNTDLEGGLSYLVYPLKKWHLQDRFINGKEAGGKIEYVIIFSIIAFIILVMACINYVNLSTAQSTKRRKEIGVRKSIGANSWQLSLQFFGESVLFVAIAMILAIGLTQVLLPVFNRIMEMNLSLNLTDPSILIALSAMLAGVSLLAGIYPALILSSFSPIHALKNKLTRELTGSTSVRKILIVVQVAASIAIIIFAYVLFSQLNFINNKNLGYDKDNVIMVEPSYRLLSKYEAFKNGLMSTNKVKSLTVGGGEIYNLRFRNYNYEWPGKSQDDNPQFKIYSCYEDFISAFDLKLLEGSGFNASDSSYQVMLTKDALERMGLENPVGSTLSIGETGTKIVGIIDDFHTESLKSAVAPVILWLRYPTQLTHIYIHYKGNPAEALESISGVYNTIEPYYSMRYKFMDDSFNQQYLDEILTRKLSLIFIVISLIIALIGIIGLSIFNLSAKVKEIAIRKIFGATLGKILGLVSKDFLLLSIAANIIALPLAWYLGNSWLSNYAYRIPLPFFAFAAIGVGITLIIILLVGFLGLKAAKENPVDSLRYE